MSDSSTVVLFEGGLDLVTPIQNTAPGTLVGCLNYEVAAIKGYRRIDGYERFDTSIGGGIVSLYRVSLARTNGDPLPGLSVGAKLLDRESGRLLGVVVKLITDRIVLYAPASPNCIFNAGALLETEMTGGGSYQTITHTVSEDFRDIATDSEEYMTELRAAQVFLRGQVQAAPGHIAGVYYGRQDVFVAIDSPTVYVDGLSPPAAVGQFIRAEGQAYVIADIRPSPGFGTLAAVLVPVGAVQTYSSTIERLSWNDLQSGTGNIGTISGVLNMPASLGSLYASMYRITNSGTLPSFTPIPPSRAYRYTAGSSEFGSTVILTDGVTSASFNVLDFSVDQGGFGTGDAEGTLYLGELILASAGWEGAWPSTVDIQDSSFVKQAEVATGASLVLPYVAGTRSLRGIFSQPQTFYQWGTYNFKATSGSELIYSTNGRTRAAWINVSGINNIWGSIVTQWDNPSLDIPKYLSFHAGQRLALGFANGSVQLSAVAQPRNFSGLDGAVEIGNGDNLTGLVEAQGDSTILFGPRTVRRIVGKGTALGLETISAESGAFDYTCSTVAGAPLYINHNGLCSLDQTSAYGDFKNSSISGAIDPFFTPRIVQDAYSTELGGTVCAFPVRAKNQYRAFLGDGSVLVMSVTPAGAQPMLSNYASPEGGMRVPIAYASSVNDASSEHILVVWNQWKKKYVVGNPIDPPAGNIIYRLDHGWGFDGEHFEHYIDNTYVFNQDPQFLSIDRAIVYGLGYGMASMCLRASGVEDDFDQEYSSFVQDISMPRNGQILSSELKRVMGEIDHANWGRAIKLRFQNVVEAGSPAVEPPHILQSMRLFIQTAGIPEN